MNKTPIILGLVLLCISACDGPLGKPATAEKSFYLADSNTPEQIKEAIQKGIVVEGMCPFQAFAAAGYPGPYMVRHDKKVWDSNTLYPPDVIRAQCLDPDDSVIELMFFNKTQFNTKKPVVFRVRFVKGKAVLIDQKGFKEE